MRRALALLLPLAACAPGEWPAGPPSRPAAIEAFAPAPLPPSFAPTTALGPPPAPRLPAGPAPEADLVMRDGARLPLRAWRPERPPRAVLLAIHGLGDHGGNFMADSGPALAAGGVLVYAYDQRGFGWTATRGLWPGRETLLADAREAAALLRARHPGLPFFVLGESLGGAVALLADIPGLDGLILSAPAIWGGPHFPGWYRPPLALAARLLGPLAVPAAAGDAAASDNRAALERFGRDPLTLTAIRFDMMRGVVEVMDAAVAALPGCCRAVPTLVLFGGQDRVVPAAAARRALRDAGVPRVVFYPEGWHLLTRDQVRGEVVRDLLAFMADPRAELPGEARGRAWLAGAP